MRFLTLAECQARSSTGEVAAPNQSNKATDRNFSLKCAIPLDRLRWFSRLIVTACEGFDELLVWPREWGIWPSTENLHLSYRLRQSYGDFRLLAEAPGHLFLSDEFEDAATFVQVCLMSLWDVEISASPDHVRVRLSHDEFVEFQSSNVDILDSIRRCLLESNVEVFSKASKDSLRV